MAAWRYLFHDLRSNAYVSDLPLNVQTMEMRMPPGVGRFQATLSLADERVSELPWRDAVEPRRNVIYAERDGTLMETCWVCWDHAIDSQKNTLTIVGTELWGYLHHRFLSQSYNFAQVDQLDIARTLLKTEFSRYNGGGGIALDVDALGTSPTGRLRDRTYDPYRDLGQMIEELSNVIDGFDFKLLCYRDSNDAIRRRFLTGYPRLGSSTGGLIFTYPGNIQSFNWSKEGSRSANGITATSDTSSTSTLMAQAVVDLDQLTAGYALLEAITQYSGITDDATLLGHAQADLALMKLPVEIPTIKVRSDMMPTLGSYYLGDDVRLQIADNAYFSPGFELNEIWRLVGIDPDPAGNNDGLILNSSDGVTARVQTIA